jgi:hypothetical protein
MLERQLRDWFYEALANSCPRRIVMEIKGDKEAEALKEVIQVVKDTRVDLTRMNDLQNVDLKLEKIQNLLEVVQV